MFVILKTLFMDLDPVFSRLHGPIAYELNLVNI